ncbi:MULTISPECIES: ABC transporter ATP-binding protein [Lactobacillaceae]|uniref:ABC transporter ATP-binding protein n=1 Tax=Lactobacillaceae TaxID=33958 RepID=UPI000C1B78D0|nr:MULTISPECIES: ABC transporter ATP-binding protein [Lactobacillaceae]
MSKLEIKSVSKTYGKVENQSSYVLKNINFTVEEGEYISIMGESGSGKTTLLNLLATLDKPTKGSIQLGDQSVDQMNDSQSADFRRDNLGFIFQKFNLLNIFTCRDNILLPIVLAKKNVEDYTAKLNDLSRKLGLEDLLEKYPYQLSGGQQQRVAAARALINSPELILADEPTGALDSSTSEKLLDILQDFNNSGQTILMVTHSAIAASHSNRVLFIKDGTIFNQIYRGDMSNEEFYTKIVEASTLLNE